MPRIVPYIKSHEQALLELERASPQGKHVRMEMVRDRLVDRSIVFDDFQIYVIEGQGNEVAGMAGVAVSAIELNGESIPVGICYDLRVKPEYRGQGLAKAMGRFVIEEYFRPRGIDTYFLTMKSTNTPVLRSVQAVLGLAHSYPFEYVTLPVARRLKDNSPQSCTELKFGVIAHDADRLPDGWFHPLGCGFALFDTYRMYRIKVVSVPTLLKWLIRTNEWLHGQPSNMPRENEEMTFAALCHCSVPDAKVIDAALQTLESHGVGYLIACCQRGDPMYCLLRPHAINALEYLAVSNLRVSAKDRFRLDVRCL